MQAPCRFTGFKKVEEPEPNTVGGTVVGGEEDAESVGGVGR